MTRAEVELQSTRPGMSVHREIAERIEESRAGAFEEAITFLREHGHGEAADALELAAFGVPEEASETDG